MKSSRIELSNAEDTHTLNFIRKVRNDLIKDFLDERFLKDYVNIKYNIRQMNTINIEMIRNSLKEKLATPLDRKIYQPIIDSLDASEGILFNDNDGIYYRDIESVIKSNLTFL